MLDKSPTLKLWFLFSGIFLKKGKFENLKMQDFSPDRSVA